MGISAPGDDLRISMGKNLTWINRNAKEAVLLGCRLCIFHRPWEIRRRNRRAGKIDWVRRSEQEESCKKFCAREIGTLT